MTIQQYRLHEPLYIITGHYPKAAEDFAAWARRSRVHYEITRNQLRLYEYNSFAKFQIFFTGPWEQISIWDQWNRRHLHIDTISR